MTDLTKWPRLLVAGDPVTREQANEILIRTDDWRPAVNDQVWESATKHLAAEYGMPIEPTGGGIEALRASWAAMRAWRKRMGVLRLQHLGNARIASSWIGGPHGWCDWDGRIGCSTYNVGKWPTVEELTSDWEAIAAAFPYLKLHAQAVTAEGEGEVAATWAVRDGRAALVEPVDLVTPVQQLDEFDMIGRIFGSGGERGVTLERLREALAQVAKAAL